MSRQFRIIAYALPLGIFLLICLFLWRGLSLDPHYIPSTLIGQKAPNLHLPTLQHSEVYINNAALQGHVSLLNVFASWCGSCREEHTVLMTIAQTHLVTLLGLDYKDTREEANHWLQQDGNPYETVAFDEFGKAGIDWGVYGTPETYLIDKQGIIRYKHVGPLTLETWENEISPMVKQLSQ